MGKPHWWWIGCVRKRLSIQTESYITDTEGKVMTSFMVVSDSLNISDVGDPSGSIRKRHCDESSTFPSVCIPALAKWDNHGRSQGRCMGRCMVSWGVSQFPEVRRCNLHLLFHANLIYLILVCHVLIDKLAGWMFPIQWKLNHNEWMKAKFYYTIITHIICKQSITALVYQ